MEAQSAPSSRRILLFAAVWPLVLAAVVLVAHGLLSHSPGGRAGRARVTDRTPRGAVLRLWAAEDQRIADDLQRPGATEYLAALTKDAREAVKENASYYADRKIDSDKELEGGHWEVTAILKLPPGRRIQGEKTTRKCTYIVTKDAGAWKVDEARLECWLCEGTGAEKCYACDGTGKEKTYDPYGPSTQTCSRCNGTGRLEEKCTICDGRGWQDQFRD